MTKHPKKAAPPTKSSGRKRRTTAKRTKRQSASFDIDVNSVVQANGPPVRSQAPLARKTERKGQLGHQFAALPIKEEAGETVVMLVTSRETGRWVLPKGWEEKRLTGAKLAAKEAYEEAGIVGETMSKPIGSYRYAKQLPEGRSLECVVKVFPMRVHELLDTWPESQQRRRQWFTLAEAALHVKEAGLVTMFLKLASRRF